MQGRLETTDVKRERREERQREGKEGGIGKRGVSFQSFFLSLVILSRLYTFPERLTSLCPLYKERGNMKDSAGSGARALFNFCGEKILQCRCRRSERSK